MRKILIGAPLALMALLAAGCASQGASQAGTGPAPLAASAPVTSATPTTCGKSCQHAAERRLARDRRRAARALQVEKLTGPQQNARESAQEYLSSQAFSRLGLIGQLSSSFGSGYSLHDATVAVSSLHVNWKSEAVQSARQYLQSQPFSCSGLTQQLDSSFGEKFTVAQATYGASKTSAC